jgi:hypothetical protein
LEVGQSSGGCSAMTANVAMMSLLLSVVEGEGRSRLFRQPFAELSKPLP